MRERLTYTSLPLKRQPWRKSVRNSSFPFFATSRAHNSIRLSGLRKGGEEEVVAEWPHQGVWVVREIKSYTRAINLWAARLLPEALRAPLDPSWGSQVLERKDDGQGWDGRLHVSPLGDWRDMWSSGSLDVRAG